ncbi:hypothetical protein KUL118_44540 [Tenacibaculum sp. KUL118]|nr:hypothetical protein KUL118_44540 [Tenacibaculum sp. KUL118]
MSSIDDAIAKGKKRRKGVAIASLIGLAAVLVIYFSWLFLTKGYAFVVAPERAATAPQFAVTSGNALFIGDKLYVFGSDAEIQVAAPKYQTASVVIDDTSPSTIKVTLTPLPAELTASTIPSLDGITWYLNEEKMSVSRTFTTELSQGSYTVRASHPHFETGEVTFDADIAQIIEKEISLSSLKGAITINSNPSGASVSLDGKDIGLTPLTYNAEGGKYAIVVTKAGLEPLKDMIEVTNQRLSPSRNYNLQPLQAQLSVSTTPQGGVLTVNNQPVDNNARVDANTQHTVKYEKTGFISQSEQITLAPGENRSLTFSLSKELGQVDITASLNAKVSINGAPQGQTPLSLSLQALPHTVTFERDGYRSVTKTITPSAKRPVNVHADMLTEFEARRREGKPLFATTLGIQLALITPKSFTMGSPANEKDRQRNEVQRDVSFSRKFWVSKHEVTQAQFAAFTGKGGGSALPVTNISWSEAAAFTNWLSQKEGLTPFYVIQNGRVTGVDATSKGYRLPTEAEWEFVAKLNRRASPTTFVWGNQYSLQDKQGNFADASLNGKQTFILKDYDDGFAGKAPVGSFKAERGGFYDLDGNVREWVHDTYDVALSAQSGRYTDYLGPVGQGKHVVKGASYQTGRLKNIRASVRSGESAPADDIGFRIARYEN